MTLSKLFPIPNYISLVVIIAVLAVTIGVSIFMTRNQSTSDHENRIVDRSVFAPIQSCV